MPCHAIHPPLPDRLLRPRPRRGRWRCGRPASSRTSAASGWRSARSSPSASASCSPCLGNPDHARLRRRRPTAKTASRHARPELAGTPCASPVACTRMRRSVAASSSLRLSSSWRRAACKEEGTVKVHSLSFKGVKAVDESRLKDALATRQSSKIPWGKKILLRSLPLRCRSEAHPGVLRRPRLSRRARHRLRRQAQRQAGRGRSDADDRRRRAGAGRRRSTSSASTRSRRRISTI